MAQKRYLALDLGAESGRGVVGAFDGTTLTLEEVHRFANGPTRMGDTLYVSGVIVHRRPGEGTDVAAFKQQVRRALDRLKFILASAGVTFADVAMINTFHVWQGPNFTGTRDEQFKAFEDVIDEFMKPPYPAWTAVGTTGLLSDGGIVEIQLIAHAAKQ